ncbi:hypothetical protein EON64_00820, partial [archaeon]
MQGHRSGLPRRVAKPATHAENAQSEPQVPIVPPASSNNTASVPKAIPSPVANKNLSSSLKSTSSSHSVDGKKEGKESSDSSRTSLSSESAAGSSHSIHSHSASYTTSKKPPSVHNISTIFSVPPAAAVKEGASKENGAHETTPVKSRRSLDGSESILSSSPGSAIGAGPIASDGNDHIKVVVRVRPLVKEEREDNIAWCWDRHRIYNTPRSVRATTLADHNPSTLGTYAFDRVYDPES